MTAAIVAGAVFLGSLVSRLIVLRLRPKPGPSLRLVAHIRDTTRGTR